MFSSDILCRMYGYHGSSQRFLLRFYVGCMDTTDRHLFSTDILCRMYGIPRIVTTFSF